MFKNHRALSTTVISIGIACGVSGCSAETDNGGSANPGPVGISDQPLAEDLAAPAENRLSELATLEFPDGRSVRFAVDEDADATVVQESGPLGKKMARPILMRDSVRDLDALQIYLALTPSDRAVPRALYERASGGTRPALAQRALVDSVAPMAAHVVSFRLVDTDQDAEYMPELCGSNGDDEFEDLCATSAAPEQWCGSGKHTWHGRTSSGNYNKSEGLTVSCNASVRTEHRRKVALTWWSNEFHMDTDEHWHFTRVENYAPASKYQRYVRMDRYNPSSPDTSVSYIRSWIGFRN